MSRSLRWLLVCVLGAVAAAGGFWLQSARQPAVATVSAAPGQDSALDAVIADLAGRPQRLDQWRGKLVVLNFWATWCPPCVKELPAFVRLQRKYGPQGLQFVGIALDGREEVAKFVAEHGIDFPVLVGEEDVARYMQRLGNTIGALPFTVVVTRDAAILHTHQGEWPEADAARVIEAALAGD
jgi:thiol-disulfide isomerase/thioredoxin